MATQKNPNDIARETLRLLVTRKMPPTPDNYRTLYGEISGEKSDGPAITAEKMLQQLAADLPRGNPELVRLGNALAAAAAGSNWNKAHRVLVDFTHHQQTSAISTSEWTDVLHELVRLAGENHHRLAAADKQAALDKTMTAGGDMQALHLRLKTLISEWRRLPTDIRPEKALAVAGPESSLAAAQNDSQLPAMELRELLAQTLENGVAAKLISQDDLAAEASSLAQRLRDPGPLDTGALRSQLKSLWLKIELRGDTRGELQSGLLDLLRLLAENVGELVADDQWLRGQIAVVLRATATPLSIEAIEAAKASLTDLICKQSLLKKGLTEVKTTLKKMVASFIDELGKLSASTGDYHDTVENLAQQIRGTEDVDQLNRLLDEVLRETREVQASTLRSRQEVLAARQQVDAAERKIQELEAELAQVSEKVREDHLTGTLNRRGLKEVLDREISIADRQEQPLSVALLDIDNFKALNDSYGHQVGDDALAHIAQVIKETLRPGDNVARFGGEEFLILLPNSDIEQAVTVMTRLQRELTRRFFLHDNRKLLITFSAGVTSYAPGETQAAVTSRADSVLYQAKRAGKNRVMAASSDMDRPKSPALAQIMPAAAA